LVRFEGNGVVWTVGSYSLKISRSPIGTLSLEFRQEGIKSRTLYPSSPFAALQMLKDHFRQVPQPVIDFLETPAR